MAWPSVRHLPSEPAFRQVGTGEDMTIRELAEKVADVIGYKGKFVQDSSRPDGTMRKVMDVSRIKQLGWSYKTSLDNGLAATYEDFLNRLESITRNE